MNENYLLTEEKINEIRSSVDIVEVIGEYIPLTGKGKNFFCVCPFHDDHSPSMSISKDRQIYKCFSCGESGNVITFVEKYTGTTFLEALKILADRAGIKMDAVTPKKVNSALEKYYEINDTVNKYFKNNLISSSGKLAIEYLSKRKIDKDIINEFNI